MWVGILYLALSLPVTVSLSVSVNGCHGAARASLFALGMGARFDALVARSGVRLRLRPRYGHSEKEHRMPRARAIRAISPMLRAVLEQIDVRRFDLSMRVGLQEASQTALTAGALQAAATAALSRLPMRRPCAIRVEPDFARACFFLTGRCIFRAMPGDIIFAALKAAIKMTRKEGFGWISSIPLKA